MKINLRIAAILVGAAIGSMLSGCMPLYMTTAGQAPSDEDIQACRKEAYDQLGWIRANPVAFLQYDREVAAYDACLKRKGYLPKDAPR